MFLTGQKDVDFLILGELEDQDLVNVSMVNKKANELCKNETFWRNRFLKLWKTNIFPINKTWKNYYFIIVKYLRMSGKKYEDSVMRYAAKDGHIDIVNLMIEKGATDFDWCMSYAALGGYMDIVKLMIEKGATDISSAIYNARDNEHIHIINYLGVYTF